MSTARQVQDVLRLWSEQFNAGDIEGLRSLYEDDAVLSAGPGAGAVRGVDAILDSWRAFAGGAMTIANSTALVRDDLAMTFSRGMFTFADGSTMDAATSEVVRRQADGSWRYVLCNPYGDSILATG